MAFNPNSPLKMDKNRRPDKTELWVEEQTDLAGDLIYVIKMQTYDRKVVKCLETSMNAKLRWRRPSL